MLSVEQINKLQEENAKLLGKLDAYKMSENEANEIIAELKHKNKLLKNTIKNKNLVDIVEENKRLKEKFEIESLTDKTTGETIYRSNVVNKLKELLEIRIEDLCESCGASSMMPMPCTVYKQTLQEIKEIAERYKDADREESEKLLCLENDMEDILYKIAECEVNE